MSQSDAMKYARKQVTDHGHATLEGVRGIRTDVPIRSSVRSPFPFARIKSKQMVKRLNAEYWGGYKIFDANIPFIFQNVAMLPAFGTPGRIVWFGNAAYVDTGSGWQPLALETTIDWSNILGKPSTFPPSDHDYEAHYGSIIPDANQDFQENEALAFRVENVATLPTAGNVGRLVCLTSTGVVYYDNGSDWVEM
jgi:hypothetical protein